jgi:hypothetical protein
MGCLLCACALPVECPELLIAKTKPDFKGKEIRFYPGMNAFRLAFSAGFSGSHGAISEINTHRRQPGLQPTPGNGRRKLHLSVIAQMRPWFHWSR